MSIEFFRKLVNFAIFLAFCVVMLGAYTRLTDAGLGCPDWPGCYGHMVLPSHEITLADAQKLFPSQPIEGVKAWTEMGHRYLAGSLLSIILVIVGFLLFYTPLKNKVHIFPLFAVIGLLIFQALLGMWTVTLKLLPTVVMGHLLGGFLILISLAAIRCQLIQSNQIQFPRIKYLLALGLLLTFLQVALGGWVSSNYAGISCMGFPTCNGMWWPDLNFKKAFDVFHQIGPNYQGGLLDVDVRMTIQWVHRLGAVVVWVYWLFVSIYAFLSIDSSRFRKLIILLQILLIVQIALGIINVLWMLPLPAAVLHNGIGAGILVTIVFLFHLVCVKKKAKYE